MADKQFTVLTDSPGIDSKDWLGRQPSAEQIADLILRSQTNSPFTIGIDGTWGTGKSTFMLMIRDKLQSLGIPTVWFNAWMHQHKENPAEGLVKSILLSLHGRLRLYRLFARRIGITLLKLALHAALGQLKVSDSVVDEIWTNFKQDIAIANEFRSKLEEAIRKRTKDKGLMVVFIDDLDRCDPRAIIRLFEAIKVYLDVKGIVFVLGYDRQALINAVQNRLIGEHAEMAGSYLEKIIQIPYPLPVPTDEQIRECLDHYLEESKTGNVFSTDIRPIVITVNRKNPRGMKRFVNSFALNHTLGFFRGELDIQVRMWLLWMYYRTLHTVFVSELAEAGHFVDYSEIRQALVKGGLDTMDDVLKDTLWAFIGGESSTLPKEELLVRLDANVPPAFIGYYNNDDAITLVGSLAEAYFKREEPEREEVSEQVKEQAEVFKREPQIFEQRTAGPEIPRRFRVISFSTPEQQEELEKIYKEAGTQIAQPLHVYKFTTFESDTVLQLRRPEALSLRPEDRVIVMTTDYLKLLGSRERQLHVLDLLRSELEAGYFETPLILVGEYTDDFDESMFKSWRGAMLQAYTYDEMMEYLRRLSARQWMADLS